MSPSAATAARAPSDNAGPAWPAGRAPAFAFARPPSGPKAQAALRDRLSAGELTGTPMEGPMIDALLALLDRRGRLPDAQTLAHALPHLTREVDAETVLDVCARLGLAGDRLSAHAARIDPTALPGLLLPSRPDDAPALLDLDAAGRLTATPLSGGPARTLPRGRIDVLLFRDAPAATAAAPGRSWLRGVAMRFRGDLSGLLRLTMAMNLLLIVVSLSVMTIYDRVLPTRSYDTLAWLAGGVAAAFALELTLRRWRARSIGRLAARFEYILSTELFAKVASLPAEKVVDAPVGDQMMRLRRFEGLRDLIAGPLSAVALEAPSVLLFSAALAWLGGPIALVPLALIVVYGLLAALHMPGLRRATQEAGRAQAEQSRLALDAVSNLVRIRELDCAQAVEHRLDEGALAAARAKRAAQEAQRRFASLAAAAPPLTGGGAALFGAWLVMQGAMTSGALIAAMILIWRVIMPVQQAMLLLARFGDVARTVDQIDRLMAMPSERVEAPGAVRRVVRGRLSCEGASFRYKGAPAPALLGASFELQPGRLAAVIGPSGAGKTTLLRLLSGLAAAQSGSVRLDGLNLRQWEPSALRGAMSFVPHAPALFHGTVAQNLRLSAPDAPLAALEALAEELGALEMIRALPQRFETRLDETAKARLPRGLSQSLALIRGFLPAPKVLLLDEPSQALSPRQEDAFLAALAARRGRMTVVMSTHRPSHMRLADVVLRLRDGRLSEDAAPSAPQVPETAR
ncbi:MAG: ATP-binding cassette domain-containing protein [Pseudomonadota bacterium]